MTTRKFNLMPNTSVTNCPKCGNNTKFSAHSDQIAEDGCEVWVVCNCGYDPTADKSIWRPESVMGGLDYGNILGALDCWADAIEMTT